MPSVYTHMNDEDVNDLILLEAGIKKASESGETDLKDRECPRCHKKNPFDAKYCNICSLALDSKVAEKHTVIVKASDAMMDMAHKKNINVRELVEKHMEEVRDKLMADLSAKGLY